MDIPEHFNAFPEGDGYDGPSEK